MIDAFSKLFTHLIIVGNLPNFQVTSFKITKLDLIGQRLITTATLLFTILCTSAIGQDTTPCESMACNNQVNVALEENCKTELTLDQIFRGSKLPDSLFEIVIKDAYGSSHPNDFDASDAGQQFKVSIINSQCNMQCWGMVTIENKNIPKIKTSTLKGMCGDQRLDFEDLDDIIAEIDNGCNLPVFDVAESTVTSGKKCEGEQIIRTVTGSVDIDNRIRKVVLRIDTILYTPLDTRMVSCPKGEDSAMPIVLECADVDAYPNPDLIEDLLGITYAYPYIYKGFDSTLVVKVKDSIRETVTTEKIEIEYGVWATFEVITKDTIPYLDSSYTYQPSYLPITAGVTCNLSTKYIDESFPNCLGEGYKIKRTWTVIDWCGSPLKYCIQWISVIDTIAPVWKAPMLDVSVNIAPWTCEAAYEIPTPDIWDECADWDVTWYSQRGVIVNNIISGLRYEDSPVKVIGTAIDKCGNEASDTFYVHVMDMTAPVAIALDEINVSLTGDAVTSEGVAKLYAESVDVSSHDSNCGEVDLCLLLKEELESPVIRDGEHLSDPEGNPIYKAAQCVVDGIYEYRFTIGKDEFIEEIPYVICKDYVKFCCQDLGENNVAMIVTDQGGKQGFTWSEVLVEDKTNTGWTCFPQTIGCEDTNGFEPDRRPIFGGILCEVYDIREIVRVEDLQCGTGLISITYGAYFIGEDDLVSQTTCTYPITGGSTFNPYEIKWPKHYDGKIIDGYRRECEIVGEDKYGDDVYGIVEYNEGIAMGDFFECTAGDGTGEPVYCGSTCGIIGMSYEDLEVIGEDACRKIVRTWTIIDWCVWDPNGSKADDSYSDSDIDTDDTYEAVDDEWLGEGDWLTNSKLELPCEECPKPSGESEHVYFRYGSVDIDGYYNYDQVIKIIDNDDPEIVVVEEIFLNIVDGASDKNDDFEGCEAESTVQAIVTDFCGAVPMDASIATWRIEVRNVITNALLRDYILTGDTVEVSTEVGHSNDEHVIKWFVEDGCGNIGFAETRIHFQDNKNPTPVCIQSLSTSAMNTDGTVAIWAVDYDLGSFDNCTSVDLAFLVDDDGDVTTDETIGNFVSSVSFDCDDLINGQSTTIEMRLYVIDEEGNRDFCIVNIRIDDNSNYCPDGEGASAIIAGALTTESGDAIETVKISLDNGRSMMTPINGQYAFDYSDMYEGYTILSYKNDDWLNGVSSADLVMIQRHILGLNTLNNPYKMIAADINSDEKVSALDILELRKLLLGINITFPDNLSWRFVDAAQVFPEPMSPWPFTEELTIANLWVDEMHEDFIGIKIGDVSGNAIANSAIASEGRSARTMVLNIENQSVRSGAGVSIPVYSREFDDVAAFQMTWELNGLRFAGIEPGGIAISEDAIGLISDQLMTMVWHEEDGLTFNEKVLFTLHFTATSDIELQDAITISSSVTAAKAYNSELESAGLELEFINSDHLGTLQFELLQNKPNPFAEMTKIGFVLPEAGEATITVFDVTGQSILEWTDTYNQGRNEVVLHKEQLRTTGVLYYQIESGNHIAISKMVLLE